MSLHIGEKTCGFILSVLLVAVIFVFIMQNVSEYSSMTSLIENTVSTQNMTPKDFKESDLPKIKSELMDNCSKSSDGTTVVQLKQNKNATLDCQNVSAIQNSEDLFSLIAISGFKEVYYQKYDCAFVSCFVQAKTINDKINLLLSEKAHKFYGNLYWYTIVAAVIAGVAFVFVAGDMFRAAKGLGWTFAIIGVGFVFTWLFKDKNIALGPSQTASMTLPVFSKIMPAVQNYLITYFVIGIVLLAFGYFGHMFLNKNNSKKK